MEKTCLICIDGWGVSDNSNHEGDAIYNAQTPVMDKLQSKYPSMNLSAHGLDVGLPEGLMGNSEVGHLNIGAGRIVYQDIVRIDLAIKKDQLKLLPNLMSGFKRALDGNGRLHLLGLVSDGGVHGHIKHLKYLLKSAKEAGIKDTFIHFFADGRDTAPKSAITYLEDLMNFIKLIGYGKMATITGRYYAMDRDKRWDRVKVAYDALTAARGQHSSDPVATIKERYEIGEFDEFLKPIIIDDGGSLKDNDTIITFNFRSDRMRELAQVLGVLPLPFDSEISIKNLEIISMTQYKADFPFKNIFPPQTMKNVLAEWLAKLKVPQCHIAETEKYAHVTFFFNGGTEASYDLEEREMIASPKVATYDLLPEMSALAVAEKVGEVVQSLKYPFVMCNFAPPDMVGHTGDYQAAIKAVEATDRSIGIVYEACRSAGYTLFVTADHGNAEQMLNFETGERHTAHTTNQVPFVMTSDTFKFGVDRNGALCDIAPTILKVMGLDIPSEMTGSSLLA